MKDDHIVERRWVRLGLIWGIWNLVGLFFTSQVYFDFYRQTAVPLLKAFVWQMTAAYAFALATPPVLGLVRRLPIERHNWLRRLSLHLLLSIIFSFILGSFHVVNDLLHMGRNYHDKLIELFQK